MKALPMGRQAFALAVCATLVTPLEVLAQNSQAILTELQSLKSRISELEDQLRQQQIQAVEPGDFNRIRAKTEALEDQAESNGFKGLRVSGMMDPSYVWSRRRDSAGFAFLNNFDGQGRSGDGADGYAFDNSYFGQAMLDFQKEGEAGHKWRLTLVPHKSASAGYNLGSIVHEASVSIPMDGPSTRMLAGQMPDWTGYEYFFSNQQPLISHNLLFDFTIPSYYSGVGMEFTRGKWLSKFMVGNINQTRRQGAIPTGTLDPNTGDSLARRGERQAGLSYRVDYAKGEFNGFGFAGTHTFEQASRADLLEVDGYFIRGDLTLQGQLGVGRAQGVSALGSKAHWTGASALLGYKVTPRLQWVLRADQIFNHSNGGGVYGATLGEQGQDAINGFGLPMRLDETSGLWVPDGQRGVNRHALSLGFNYLLASYHTPNSGLWPTGTWFKMELRHDGASGAVLMDQRTGRYIKSTPTVLTSLVMAF